MFMKASFVGSFSHIVTFSVYFWSRFIWGVLFVFIVAIVCFGLGGGCKEAMSELRNFIN